MKKCCLLFAVLLFPLLAMTDYELDWPEADIKKFVRAVFNLLLKPQVVLMLVAWQISRLPAFVTQKCWISFSAMKTS